MPLGLFVGLMVMLSMSAQAADDLAKAAQNPVADLISLPFQNNTNYKLGANQRTQNILNIQPVWPIGLNDDWNLITRTIVPVMSQPIGRDDRKNGIGDTTFTGFFSPKESGNLTWGVGPMALIPTSSDDVLGGDDWGLGLSVVALTMPGNWVVGSLFSNLWTDKDESGARGVNLFTWQYFINYNIPDSGGLYLLTAPIITANWEADSDNRWTVPIGGGIGKIFKIGEQPVNGQISAYYNIEAPENGADWQLRAQLQLLFPK